MLITVYPTEGRPFRCEAEVTPDTRAFIRQDTRLSKPTRVFLRCGAGENGLVFEEVSHVYFDSSKYSRLPDDK